MTEEYPVNFVDALKAVCALNWSPENDKSIQEIFGLNDSANKSGVEE